MTKTIPLSHIIVGERFRKDYGDINELAENIRMNGLISPLAVQELAGDRYNLLAGGRRYQACTLLKLEEVPVRVFPSDLGVLSARTIELAENIARKALTWQEQAALTAEINRLQMEQHGKKASSHPGAEGWSQNDTARLLGVDKQTVSDDLKLARATEELPEIAACTNKSEALALLAKRKAEVITAELARRVEQRTKNTADTAKSDLLKGYIVGDCFEHIDGLPNRAFDLVEIDPPYGVDLDEVRGKPVGGSLARGAGHTHSSTVRNYADVPSDEYPAFMRRLLKAVYPKVSDLGWVIVWFGSSRWHDSVREWLKEAGFMVYSIPAMWVKPTPGSVIQPSYMLGTAYEGFYYARKTAAGQIAQKGRSNVFQFKHATVRGGHPTERPIELIQEILATFGVPGSRVLVPFLGSGNTLLAAANLKMSAIGFEIAKENRAAFVVNVERQIHGAYTSYQEA